MLPVEAQQDQLCRNSDSLGISTSPLHQQKVELKGDASGPVTPVKIPDCPVPADLLDQLLKPPASISKEPLNNLHNCLRQLK